MKNEEVLPSLLPRITGKKFILFLLLISWFELSEDNTSRILVLRLCMKLFLKQQLYFPHSFNMQTGLRTTRLMVAFPV